MPFDSLRSRRAITASLGVLILVATVFAPFGTIVWSHKYTVEQVEPDDPQLGLALSWPDQTTLCYSDYNDCDLLYSLKDNESRVVSYTTYRAAQGVDPETELAIFPESTQEFYQLQFRPYENGTARVGLTRVSNTTALELASTPSYRYPDDVQNLIEKGQLRTDEQPSGYALWEHTNDIIAHDDAYYRQASSTLRGPTWPITAVLRLGLLAVGAALCYRAGRIE